MCVSSCSLLSTGSLPNQAWGLQGARLCFQGSGRPHPHPGTLVPAPVHWGGGMIWGSGDRRLEGSFCVWLSTGKRHLISCGLEEAGPVSLSALGATRGGVGSASCV